MQRTFLLRVSLAAIAVLAEFSVWSQTPSVLVYGIVKDMTTRDSVPNAWIKLDGENGAPVKLTVNERGRYEFELTEEKVYLIRCGASGKVDKSVVVDTRGPTPEQWEGGYGMNVDFVLLDSLPGIDYAVLREPFGKARFVPISANFEWDMEYTQGMRDRQAALLDAYNANTPATPRTE